jgi:ABC-type branched-subunit amino acid transport system ATPase component
MASRSPAGPAAIAAQPRARLVISDLSVSFGGVRAIDGVDLSVASGELVGLIGPNGAGKSTFVDAVTGFVDPARGRMRFLDRTTTRWSPARLAHAGLVRTFQHLELFDDLTVRENISVAARSTRRGSAAARSRAIELCGLADIADHLVTQVPAGRRRLVALARALAAAPLILLADEPAAGLDTHESAELGILLRRLADNGIGILLIDHDMNLVLSACDRLAVLVSGTKIAEGTPAQVRADEAVIAAYLGGTS